MGIHRESIVIEQAIAPASGRVVFMVYKASSGRKYASVWSREEWAIEAADNIGLKEGISIIVRMDSISRNESGVDERSGMSLARW
jgi:hypothetical protein